LSPRRRDRLRDIVPADYGRAILPRWRRNIMPARTTRLRRRRRRSRGYALCQQIFAPPTRAADDTPPFFHDHVARVPSYTAWGREAFFFFLPRAAACFKQHSVFTSIRRASRRLTRRADSGAVDCHMQSRCRRPFFMAICQDVPRYRRACRACAVDVLIDA